VARVREEAVVAVVVAVGVVLVVVVVAGTSVVVVVVVVAGTAVMVAAVVVAVVGGMVVSTGRLEVVVVECFGSSWRRRWARPVLVMPAGRLVGSA
jgi:hypothetical protein